MTRRPLGGKHGQGLRRGVHPEVIQVGPISNDKSASLERLVGDCWRVYRDRSWSASVGSGSVVSRFQVRGTHFQWKNALPWHLGSAAKVRFLRLKNLPPFRHYLVFKTTFEVFTRVSPDNSLERLTERSVGLVTGWSAQIMTGGMALSYTRSAPARQRAPSCQFPIIRLHSQWNGRQAL